MALVVTTLSKSYDFFLYYFTLVITPMMLFGGVFFPLERLPGWIQETVGFLPLTLGIGLIRPFVVGRTPDEILGPLVLLALYTLVAYQVAVRLLRRRLRS
jgi:lipooligosaccharide transport system permease protein